MATLAIAPAPSKIEEVGVKSTLLTDLALKILYLVGGISLRELSDRIRLNYGVVEQIFQKLRKDQLVEVTGMTTGVHSIAATSQGRSRALDLLAHNQYSGPAPVSFDDYVKCVEMQSVRDVTITPNEVDQAFSPLVLTEDVKVRLGTAMTSGRAIFLYGPTGTGKTSIAEHIADVFAERNILIPHAIEIDGQIVAVFDPGTHTEVEPLPPGADRRWALCRRPRVMVGGELTIDMLDLQFNPITKFYVAPVQMKANNGVLIVDDFGRQRVRPTELLNRWVVPLERRIDFLTLAGGRKIDVPFDLFVVFATNLDPNQLADEAFLRRIQTKIKIDCVTPEEFKEILRRVCEKNQIEYDETVASGLIYTIESQLNLPLRPCYPRDIVMQICWAAQYAGLLPMLTPESVRQACLNYFVQN